MKRIMKTLKNLLLENDVFCGTVGVDGFPSAIPVSLLMEKDKKLYFSISDINYFWENLTYNPFVSLTLITEQNEWLQLVSYIEFEENNIIKSTVFSQNKQLQQLFGTADNPAFQVFYLSNGTAKLYNGSQQLQQTFDIQTVC